MNWFLLRSRARLVLTRSRETRDERTQERLGSRRPNRRVYRVSGACVRAVKVEAGELRARADAERPEDVAQTKVDGVRTAGPPPRGLGGPARRLRNLDSCAVSSSSCSARVSAPSSRPHAAPARRPAPPTGPRQRRSILFAPRRSPAGALTPGSRSADDVDVDGGGAQGVV